METARNEGTSREAEAHRRMAIPQAITMYFSLFPCPAQLHKYLGSNWVFGSGKEEDRNAELILVDPINGTLPQA